MAVNLSPATALNFNRPFRDSVKRELVITNRNAEPIAFKVKTTAPKAYCVRPNSGRIEPGESVEVQVILQAMKEDPPPNFRCKDKFLVLSMTITKDMRDVSLSDMWTKADQDPNNHPVHQQRLKVIFLPAEGRVDEVDENINSTFLSADNSRYDTVRQFPQTMNGHPSAATVVQPPPFEPIDRGASPILDFHAASEVPAIEEVMATTTTVTSRVPMARVEPEPSAPSIPIPDVHLSTNEFDELKLRYSEAQDEIARLRALLATMPDPSLVGDGLRRRRSGGESTVGDGSTEIDEDDLKKEAIVGVQQEGVPPQMVAVIALLVFTLTYLFF